MSEQVLEPLPPGETSPPAGTSTGHPEASAGADEFRHVEKLLAEEPASFEFFQAVRLLRNLRPDRAAPGGFVDPRDEVVRFSVPASIAFPPTEVESLDLPAEGKATMRVNFLGLTGPQGVLPHHYTLLIGERKRAKDNALGDFFDLFQHRAISLFYSAWQKYHFPVGYELQDEDALTAHLRDLIGIGLPASRNNLPLPEDALLFYTGLLGPQPRGAQALEQLLSDFFDLPVQVEQFVGRWYPLPRHDQCAIGEEDDLANRLGLGAVVGDEIWDSQTCVRVRIGPLTRPQYDTLLPGGEAHAHLRALTRFFSHDQFEFQLQLVLARDEVPGLVLGESSVNQPLGWATWVRTRDFDRDADDTILTL